MKVAFTSSTGEIIDQHFGQCKSFYVWEIGPDEAQLVTTIRDIATDGDEEDRIAARSNALGDCCHRLYHADRRTGGGQTGGAQDPPDEDQQ